MAIISNLPLISDIARWHPTVPSSPPTSDIQSTIVNHLQELLILCANAACLASKPLDAQEILDHWRYLHSKLQALHSNRSAAGVLPLLASPIAGISISNPSSTKIPTSFPLSIYTSRMSFFSTLLYHLTSLLLLQFKPRRVDARSAKFLKTTTWHAVEVCGLSLSNPLLWSWDPIVVAALIRAGLSLSYVSQQEELFAHLRRLESLTGWILENELRDLKEFWKMGR